MRDAAIVEARIAPHPETDLAANRLRSAHEVVRDPGVLDRHEVRHLGHAAVGEKARQQDVGVRKVELLVHRIVELRRDLKAAAAIGVEQRGKDGRRIERGEAEKVDRPALAHERDGMKVADDAVVFNRSVSVGWHGKRCVSIVGGWLGNQHFRPIMIARAAVGIAAPVCWRHPEREDRMSMKRRS